MIEKKSYRRCWVTESATAEEIFASRLGGLEGRGENDKAVERGIKEITCRCGRVKSGLGYSVMSCVKLSEIEGAVGVSRTSSVLEAIKSAYISSSS